MPLVFSVVAYRILTAKAFQFPFFMQFFEIMTPKEKANELYKKFRNENPAMAANVRAKKQAIICVDEIINNQPFRDYGFSFDSISSRLDAVEKYWNEVKQELIKLS